MWEKVGLERTEEELLYAKEKFFNHLKEAKYWERNIENRRILDILLVAYLTVEGALRRKESRGVHFRKDFPYEREIFRKDTVISENPLQDM